MDAELDKKSVYVKTKGAGWMVKGAGLILWCAAAGLYHLVRTNCSHLFSPQRSVSSFKYSMRVSETGKSANAIQSGIFPSYPRLPDQKAVFSAFTITTVV